MAAGAPHRLVVVGAGFAGLQVVKRLGHDRRFQIVLIDKRNHHLFQPLLYQAASSILPPSQIAWPIRRLTRRLSNVTTLLAEVAGVDTAIESGVRQVRLTGGGQIPYDTLVLATGAAHAYFGHDDWAASAPGLKTLEDATTIRQRILTAFERAEASPDEAGPYLTFAIVGAGPTGVELAGSLAELARTHLPDEFRRIDTRLARIVLIEAGERILPTFDPSLSAYAAKALQTLGVEVRTGEAVTACDADGVTTTAGVLPAKTIIWAAGVQASPAADWLHLAGDRAGRSPATPNLTAPGLPDVFVIGDTASVGWKDGSTVPGIAPAAKEQGDYVARVLKARVNGRPPPPPFHYRHWGSLATIGRNRAIIDFGEIKLKGRIAWWLWGAAHIYFLITARSRWAVASSWLYAYARNEPAARLITWPPPDAGPEK
ncbi:MAG TPA: NAD(P)/FAD-dependent oxidoreductase [Caulobacteraceae bacterium]